MPSWSVCLTFRVMQVKGDLDWTSRQLGALRRRAHALPIEDARAAHMATATLLASM